jgi:mono/diheme cytochrome c family protein
VKALAIFLKSRRGVNFAETTLDRYKAHIANVAVVIPPGTAGKKAGEQLIAGRACTACHKLRDKDGGIAPDLTCEGLIRDNPWLMDHFKNPRSCEPDSIMPSFRFPDEDFQRLAAYLGSLKTPPPAAAPAETFKGLCARCHGEKGDGAGKVAWYLDPAPRDFTKAAFMTSKPRARFLDSIRKGVPPGAMRLLQRPSHPPASDEIAPMPSSAAAVPSPNASMVSAPASAPDVSRAFSRAA